MGNSIAVNDGSLAYQWQKKDYGTNTWTNVPGATDSTYTTAPATQGDDRDEFRCGITSPGAVPILSQAAIFNVNIGATVIANFAPTQIFNDD